MSLLTSASLTSLLAISSVSMLFLYFWLLNKVCTKDYFLYVTTIRTKLSDCIPFYLPFLSNSWAALRRFSVFSDNLFIFYIS